MPLKIEKAEKTFGALKTNEVNKIYVGVEADCEMATVELNGKNIMIGNFWDFHNGCYGLWDIPDFKGYSSLVSLIELYCEKAGVEYKIEIDRSWKYS